MCFEGTVWLCLLWSVSHLGEVTAASGRPYGRSRQTGGWGRWISSTSTQSAAFTAPHRTGSRTLASNPSWDEFSPTWKKVDGLSLWRRHYFHVFSTKDFNTKQAGHLKDKMPLETGFLCFTESLGSWIRRMWRTQKPWELETSKQEEMSRLPIFASQHDVCLKLKQMLKKTTKHNTQHSSVVVFFFVLVLLFWYLVAKDRGSRPCGSRQAIHSDLWLPVSVW